MTKELGETDAPLELVPGDSDSVSNTLWVMRGYGDALHDAGAGLQRIDTTEGWSGAAGDAFRKVFHGQPGKWTEAGDCFHNAANALETYGSILTWAQGQAADAIRMWNDGQAATNTAKNDHALAVQQAQQKANAQTAAGTPTVAPNIPFVDPGEAKRQAARETLNGARAQLNSAGDTAEHAVGLARDKAPHKPGFWSKVGHAFEDLGRDAENIGATALNDLASFGNAVINHPGDVGLAAAGALLTTVSAAGDGIGSVLAVTGVGTIPGLALDAASTVGVVGGVGMTTVAMRDLMMHASSDDSVSPVSRSGGSSGDTAGPTESSDGDLSYEKSDKHGSVQRGNVGAAPTNGQQA